MKQNFKLQPNLPTDLLVFLFLAAGVVLLGGRLQSGEGQHQPPTGVHHARGFHRRD